MYILIMNVQNLHLSIKKIINNQYRVEREM